MSAKRYQLGLGFGFLSLLGISFAAGVAVEHTRPCGTEWHRKQTVHLASLIASMRAERCCHD